MRFILIRITIIGLFLSLTQFLSSQSIVSKDIEKPSVGLVLSGGGAKGFSYVGLLKVLEEVDMPIDYIGGSSIGAIIGALYATGYSPEKIEELIREQNWDDLINDKLERKYISYEEKLFADKYIFTIPIEESGFTLSSIMGSFNIDLMLNKLFAPVAHIEDFKELPIPFLCIGTDLITGEAVVLDSGNVARAIRASMAIPGYFPPIKYGDNYLIDGGVVNNYPAEQIKDLNIDIIVGGDVQSGLKSSMDELRSVPAILDQVISFNRIDANKKGWALTDHYVHISMPYGMLDFSQYDSIIAYGERVAREHYDELKNLADSVNALRSDSRRELNTQPLDSIKINEIRLQGMKWQQQERFKGYFEGLEMGEASIDEIEERMKLLKGTGSFHDLYYELNMDDPEMANLDIYATAPNLGSLSAGIHSDDIYHGSILASFALRNIKGTRAKFFADLVLGQNPRLHSMLIVNNGFKPGIGATLDFYRFTFPLYNNDKKINTWHFETFNSSLFIPMTVKNNFFFRTGFEYELFRFRQDIIVDSTLEDYQSWKDYGDLFVEFNYDNRDKVYFSTKGRTVHLSARHAMPFSKEWNNFVSNATIFKLEYKGYFSLSERLVFNPGFFAGYTLIKEDPQISPYSSDGVSGNLAPVQHLFGFGGLNPNNYVDNHIAFTGLRFIERLGMYAGKVSLNFQYNFYPKLYATFMSDFGLNEISRHDIISENLQGLVGVGLKLSYDSFIGPVEVSFMKSNISKSPMVFLNIGYWF